MTNAKKMDKEKESEAKIDKLAIQICRDCDSDWCRNRQCYCTNAKKRAERLVKAGYGNIKQAVKGFADELKELFKAKHAAVMANVACNRIDELLKERYGEE